MNEILIAVFGIHLVHAIQYSQDLLVRVEVNLKSDTLTSYNGVRRVITSDRESTRPGNRPTTSKVSTSPHTQRISKKEFSAAFVLQSFHFPQHAEEERQTTVQFKLG